MLKVVALQVGRPEVPQVVQPAELQAVQPGEVPLEVPLEVQPVPVRQAQLVPQVRLLVRSPGLLALSVWSVR